MTNKIIDKSNWKLTKFGSVVTQQKGSVDINKRAVGTRFIAGEHINSEDTHINKWGVVDESYLGPAFHRTFQKGDILYGSRRTYLKKVAVAHFDGITSNTTFVIQPNKNLVDERLIPFLMLSDKFTKHSVKNSKGSVNPYINWKDIADFEFLLPSLDEQKKIADLLWSGDRLRSLYIEQVNKLITFSLSYFSHHYQEKTQKLSSISDLFTLNPIVNNNLNDEDEVDFIGMEDISEGGKILAAHKKKYIEVKSGYKRFETGDILFAKITPCMENGKGAIVEKVLKNGGFGSTEFHVIRPKNKADSEYIFYLLKMPFFRKKAEAAMVGSAGQKRVPKSFFERFMINFPSSENRILIGKKTREIFDVIHNAQVIIQKSKEINNFFVNSFFG